MDGSSRTCGHRRAQPSGVRPADFDPFVRNVCKVLLTREVVGAVVYSADPQTREMLKGLMLDA